jgi:uncharacterized membrane protein YfcA
MGNIIIIIFIGIVAGWLSGLIGIGGGVIIVPALMFILGYSIKDAQGTSIAALIPPIGIVAAYVFYKNGHVEIKTALLLALGFVLGAFLGAKTNMVMSNALTEKAFAVVLMLIAVKILFFK